MKVLDKDHNFLGINDPQYYAYDLAKSVLQQIPYEHTSSYHQGSSKGPGAILAASHYVEFYDPELDDEAFRKTGIAVLPEMELNGKVDEEAMELITMESALHLSNNKFLITLGAEHTITYGVFKAFKNKFPEIGILQLDAHSDLRQSYQDNKWSHASVMARIHDLNVPIFQVGIRAQCIEESIMIKEEPLIHTWYAHQIQDNDLWMDELVSQLPPILYITVDTDGFDPGICPSVGTAEPGGLRWYQTLKLLRKVFNKSDVKGFDIVELNPVDENDLTAYTMAQLCYKMIGYKYSS